jgi:hypothetical protein
MKYFVYFLSRKFKVFHRIFTTVSSRLYKIRKNLLIFNFLKLIKISNEVLNNIQYDYYKEIVECLIKNKDSSIKGENYLEALKDMNFKSTNATHLLLFYETC